MNRRDFLRRMGILGLAVATPKIIIDLAANTYREPKLNVEKLQQLYEDMRNSPHATRIDIRYSDEAARMLERYNFIHKVRSYYE